MEKKKALRIALDELCEAMGNSSYKDEYYLNLETGEILFLTEYSDDKDSERLRKRLDDEPDRYEQIPKAESHDGYNDMLDFIATVKDEHLIEILEIAVNGKGAFRRFKDVLINHSEERERWFHFSDARIRERALEWLNDIGVSLIKE